MPFLLRWIQHRPIEFAGLCLLATALVIVIVDLLRYFGYYFRNQWTEATWVDNLTDAATRSEEPSGVLKTHSDGK